MYRVVVKSHGKYNNVILGARYCFTKRSAINLAVIYTRNECEFNIEKFICLNNDIFVWSDSEVSKKIWNKVYEILEGEKEDA